jgi:hypothetical protein
MNEELERIKNKAVMVCVWLISHSFSARIEETTNISVVRIASISTQIRNSHLPIAALEVTTLLDSRSW